jgi:hypothetical protein
MYLTREFDAVVKVRRGSFEGVFMFTTGITRRIFSLPTLLLFLS